VDLGRVWRPVAGGPQAGSLTSSGLNKDDSIDETVRLVSRHVIQFYGPYGSQERPILSEVARLLLSHECRITEIEAKLGSAPSEPQKPSKDLHKDDSPERPQFNASRMTMENLVLSERSIVGRRDL
jgi:hypothetical protein